jgi:inorganic phosphate transporter, PiT family
MAGALAVLALAAALAFANGSNDASKGIATLVGSGVTNFRGAALWGTVWTVVGGLVAAVASRGLVETFAGKGFLTRGDRDPAFLAAVATGALVWVLLASRTGLPVSTTHAIAGALAGAGILAEGVATLHWASFARRVALPLALSPVLSIGLLRPRLGFGQPM